VAVRAVDIAHEGTKPRERKEATFGNWQCYNLPERYVLTQSGATPDCQKRPLVPRSRFRQQVSASVACRYWLSNSGVGPNE
jgi:hypothetical protein